MGRQIDWEKRREWEDRLARRVSSGLTVAEFCEWEGVSVAAFYRWPLSISGRFLSVAAFYRKRPANSILFVCTSFAFEFSAFSDGPAVLRV